MDEDSDTSDSGTLKIQNPNFGSSSLGGANTGDFSGMRNPNFEGGKDVLGGATSGCLTGYMSNPNNPGDSNG